VITVSNSAVATCLAITSVSAIPVFVDIDQYYHIDSSKIEEKITPRTKAVLPVHLYGQACKMDSIVEICKKHNLFLVEDACQAHGASYNDKMVGSFGMAGCFSFYPTKNLGCFGDGGAIVTNDKNFYDTCRMIRNYGQSNRYEHQLLGVNSRLDEIQAALLSLKLKRLDRENNCRKKLSKRYKELLSKLSWVKLPQERALANHVYHLFVIELGDFISRDDFQKYLSENGVQTLIHFPIPIHKQQCYKEYNSLKLPKTEHSSKHILSIPMRPNLQVKEIDWVSKLFYDYKNYEIKR